MNKKEFLEALENALKNVSKEEREQTIAYYSEMIDDRCDSGMTEKEAVYSLGRIEDITRGMFGDEQVTNDEKTDVRISFWGMVGRIIFCLFFICVNIWAWGLDLDMWISGLSISLVSAFQSSVSNGGLVFVGCGIIMCSIAFILCVPFYSLTKWTVGKIKSYFIEIKTFFKGKEA